MGQRPGLGSSLGTSNPGDPGVSHVTSPKPAYQGLSPLGGERHRAMPGATADEVRGPGRRHCNSSVRGCDRAAKCGGQAGRGYSADRVSPGLSTLTLRVSMAPVPIPGAKLFGSREVESAHRLTDSADLGSSSCGLMNRRPLRPQTSWREKRSKSTFSYRTPVQYL